MGGGRWTSDAWSDYKSTRKAVDNVDIDRDSYRSVLNHDNIDETFDPLKIEVRECLASDDHPNPTPIIVALDQTGSMGEVVHDCLKQLNSFITQLYDKKPVVSPQLCCMTVGDMAMSEKAPLQVTQFESDIRIAEQLAKLYIEGCGGGNDSESYTAPWFFAANKTRLDIAKQGRKGFLFTIGDECCPAVLKSSQIVRYIDKLYVGPDMTAEELYLAASKYFHIFHIVVEEGSHMRYHRDQVFSSWKKVLPETTIPLNNTSHLAEVLIATLQMYGANMTKDEVVNDWDGTTALATVKHAISTLGKNTDTSGLVTL